MSSAFDYLAAAEAALAGLRGALEGSAPQGAPATPEAAPAAPRGLADAAQFFDAIRSSKALGPTLNAGEVQGCNAILQACVGQPLAWTAYILATPVVETNGTMQPIDEIGGEAYFRRRYDIEGQRPDKARELGNLTPGDGARFHGRGFAQITGRANYARAERKLGHPLIEKPELALEPEVAAAILVRGMTEGWFTGKSLRAYLPERADIHQFANARRVVNGSDRAAEIAGYALEFQAALTAGGWR